MRRLRPRALVRLVAAAVIALAAAGWMATALTTHEHGYLECRFLARPTRDLIQIEQLPEGHPGCMVVYASWISTTTSYGLYEFSYPEEEGARKGPAPRWIVEIAERNAEDTMRTEVGWPLRFARVEHVFDDLSTMCEPLLNMHGVLWVGPVPLSTRPLFPGFLLLIAAAYGVLLSGESLLRIPSRVRTRRRRDRGCCTACGYDQNGLSGAVCPECGVAGD